MIQIQIGQINKTFKVFKTNATGDFDGFGTFTVRTVSNTERIVLIDTVHQSWQTNRYLSGNYRAEEIQEQSLIKHIENRLFQRLVS